LRYPFELMTVSSSTLSEIESALKEYCGVVLTAELGAGAQAMYIDHATNFVRWLRGEFVPGSRTNPHPLRRMRHPIAGSVTAANPRS
jgi:hypothetical protein